MSDYQFNPNIEQWKEIPGYPGYHVSDHGRVKKSHKILKQRINERGYFCVFLNKKNCQVSRLALTAFIGPCPPKMQACHNNGNPAVNCIFNLRWDTIANNHKDKLLHGTSPRGKKYTKYNTDLSNNGKEIIRSLYGGGFHVPFLSLLFSVRRDIVRQIVR